MAVLNVMCHGESSAREARAKILVYIYIYICLGPNHVPTFYHEKSLAKKRKNEKRKFKLGGRSQLG